MILNRLQKNYKKLAPWAKRINVEAYRLYDKDIPEFPFLIDIYGDHVVVYDKTDAIKDKDKNQLPIVIEALRSGLGFSSEKLVIKKRLRQEGKAQYERIENLNQFMVVKEHNISLEVNLYDYLDTGLFLDHRPMRFNLNKEVRAFCQKNSKAPDVLNLFCYTGAVSVAAASAGAKVTSVDMSATYLDWAKRNFAINNINLTLHHFIQEDAIGYLQKKPESMFDIVFLDPPTFSNSKRMEDSFEVERDQEFIVRQSMARLKPSGVLYFSNNKRTFRLSENLKSEFNIQDITEQTIPPDCHDKKIHYCFAIRFK